MHDGWDTMYNVVIYTDGACIGNPGPGGWAAVLTIEGKPNYQLNISGGAKHTTNNVMELTAVIEALKRIKTDCAVTVVSDSQYVVNAFNKKWVYKWEKSGWKDRPNSELWKAVLPLVRKYNVQFKWIKGHAGHHYNELCDSEAQRQAKIYSLS